MQLDALFHPVNVAVIGASHTPGKVGHTVLNNLVEAGYRGNIFPVNPKASKILGLPVTHSVAELPSPVDLALIAVPRKDVVPTLKALVEHRLRAAVIISSGFKETGKEGLQIEEEVGRICRDNDVALVGPNCLGVLSTWAGLNASFISGLPKKGNIAFFSQSGALCSAILDWAKGLDIGFSKFVSLGNKAVVDESHMLYYLAQDPETKVVLGYIEKVEHGEAFLRMARRITREKPVIMLKSGNTMAGAKAVSSHTGSMVGSDKAYAAAFQQTGIIRAADLPDMFDLAMAFSTQPLPRGPRLAIVTNAGAPAVMAADATERSQLSMATLSSDTVAKLSTLLPTNASLYNPIDILADADAMRFGQTTAAALADPMVDSLLVIIAPSGVMEAKPTAQAVAQALKDSPKPVCCCFMGQASVGEGIKIIKDAGIPCYPFPERAVKSLEAMYDYSLWKSRPSPVMASVEGRKDVVRRIIREARAHGLTEIVDHEAQEILKAYDMPAAPTILARTSDEAVAAAQHIGYPAVCKVASPQVQHKADAGAVVVGITGPEQMRAAFMEITGRIKITRPDAHINGCLVQAQAPANVREVVLGFQRDDQFGPLLMFGLGGIYVDVLGDVSYRLAPISMHDARQLIRDIRSFMLLKGVRGEAPVNTEALEDLVIRLSQLAIDFPEIYQADLNPVLVNNDGAVAADVRMMLLPL